ncbi:hypothetical protein J6590_046145 [Homalodisca vitripennis]|nr:hypothetical protein J6590_046145 [Homalodisca vitripennis]
MIRNLFGWIPSLPRQGEQVTTYVCNTPTFARQCVSPDPVRTNLKGNILAFFRQQLHWVEMYFFLGSQILTQFQYMVSEGIIQPQFMVIRSLAFKSSLSLEYR